MVNFDCVYNIINDEEKRNVVTALIKEIEIYRNDESEYPLKRIGLNFPVFKDGGEVTELLWDKGNTVETVVLLSKGMADSRKVKVDFSLEDMDLSEFKGKATYEQIKAYVLEQTELKVSSLYIAQIKKKCGLDVGENFNLPKSENARQPQCTPEKEDAIMQAFRHFGII
jgi:site-specific DNA recombinase